MLDHLFLQGNSPQAMSLARGIGVKLHELRDLCARAVMNTDRSGIRRPAPTLEGKLEQAKRWMHRPEVDDKGLGMFKTLYFQCYVRILL